MKLSKMFLLAAGLLLFSTPASAQSLNDPLTGGLYGSQPRWGSQPDWRNQPSWQDRQDQDRLENEIRDLENKNRRLRALRAQERNRQRRRDPLLTD